MSFRNLFLAITMLAAANAAAWAQVDQSQRMLPLPQRQLPGLEQQMELLKRLRSLIESRQQQEPINAPDTSKPKSSIDPQQFEQLRNALQNIQEKLPPGFVPPDLSSIPPEQLRKAIENPAVQQQMREMLKQFSKDGVLPPSGNGDGTNPQLPGLPPTNRGSRPEDRNPKPPESSPDSSPPDNDADSREDKSPSTVPPASMQSLQDFLKKLAEDPRPNEPSPNPAVTKPPRPGALRKKEYNSPPNQPRPNDVPAGIPVPESRPPAAETPSADSLLPPSPSPRTSPNPGFINPGISNPGVRELRKTAPAGEPSLDPSGVTPKIENANAESQQRALKTLQDLIEEMGRQSQAEPGSSADSGSAPPSEQMPRQGGNARSPQTIPLPSPSLRGNSRSNETAEPDSQSSSQNRMLPGELPRPNTSNSGGSERSGNANPRSDLPSDTKPVPQRMSPPMDIQKELERNGFGGTLKKIVEKARQESRQPRPAGNNSITPNGTASANPQASPGLEQSMIRMLDGMKDDLTEIAKESRISEPSRRPEPRRQSPSPRRDSGMQSDSTLNRIRKAAGDLFSGPAKSTQRNTPSGGSSASLNAPSLDSQFDLTPVAVLAGLIAAVAAGFFGLRFLKLRTAISTSVGHTAAPIAPAEIENREDVIRAFHEFALRSTKSVQSWWTHRVVERVIATASPEKKAAVETLANTYEQARYLPQELELSLEQIHLTRIALQQCAN